MCALHHCSLHPAFPAAVAPALPPRFPSHLHDVVELRHALGHKLDEVLDIHTLVGGLLELQLLLKLLGQL